MLTTYFRVPTGITFTREPSGEDLPMLVLGGAIG